MRGFLPALVLLAVAGTTSAVVAQERPADPPPAAEAPIDATKLGVSLDNIKKGLRIDAAREAKKTDGLRLEYQVQVFGRAPRIEVLSGVDLFNGPVPGSAPTHSEFVQFVTPQIYRQPALPVSAFAAWAAEWLWEKNKKTRCEEEIANYRALIMQGVPVSAPRCTQ